LVRDGFAETLGRPGHESNFIFEFHK